MGKLLNLISKKVRLFIGGRLEKLSEFSTETFVVIIYAAFVLAVIVFLIFMFNNL